MNSIIIYIAKNLPSFIYKPLSQLYQKYNSKVIWDKELIGGLIEYSSLSYNEVVHVKIRC